MEGMPTKLVTASAISASALSASAPGACCCSAAAGAEPGRRRLPTVHFSRCRVLCASSRSRQLLQAFCENECWAHGV